MVTLQGILRALGARKDIKIIRINVVAAKSRLGRMVRSAPPGFPDIIGWLVPNARGVAIEVKSSKGKLSPEQEAFKNMFLSIGGLYILARSVEDAVSAVNQALTP